LTYPRVYKTFIGELERETPLGRTGRRLEDNIKMDFEELGCGSVDWIYLAQDRT
jgi:hypothetical protein